MGSELSVMPNKKKVLIICFTDIKATRRAYRQILALKNEYEIHTIGYSSSDVEGVYFYEAKPAFKKMSFVEKFYQAFFFLIGAYNAAYSKIYRFEKTVQALQGKQFDLVIVHDLKPYPLLDKLKINAPVILDAHEYYFDRGGGTLVNRLLLDRFDAYLSKKYFQNQQYVITVGEWIADQYRKMLPRARVEVVTSAADFVDITPSPVQENKIRIIHHGAVDPHRKTHLMIELADYLDERFEVDLMLVCTSEPFVPYFNQLKEMCAQRKNVRIIPPVGPMEVIPFANQYDIGLYIMPDDSSNMKYCLPNKFFEFIQSRLALAITPNPEMKKIIEDNNLGIVADNFSPQAMANALNNISATQIQNYKSNSNKTAKAINATTQMQKLKDMISDALR